jgi:hypothetical protein
MSPSVEESARSLSRLVDRLRSVSSSRLSRPVASPGGRSLADAGYELSQWCVAAEAGVSGRGETVAPSARPLPRLADLAAGDQLQVVASDLLAALVDVPSDEPVWYEGERVASGEVLAELGRRLADLRAVA